jgi:hypothetical protein
MCVHIYEQSLPSGRVIPDALDIVKASHIVHRVGKVPDLDAAADMGWHKTRRTPGLTVSGHAFADQNAIEWLRVASRQKFSRMYKAGCPVQPCVSLLLPFPSFSVPSWT